MGLLGLLTILVWLGLSTGWAQTLSLEGQRGAVGETVAFTVWIHEAPNNVGAFSFEVTYDPRVLTYKNKIGQELLDRFVFDAIGRGDRVQVAGFSAGEIAAGSSGRLVTLEFEVRKPETTTLAIHNLLDQVAGWSMQPGFFEPVLPPSDSDPREEQTAQPSQEQREKGSTEPSLTLAEQMERQVQLLLSEPGQLPSVSAPSAITSPAMQSHGIDRSAQLASRNRATQSETVQAHESGQVISGRMSAHPLADGDANSTPSTSVPIPALPNGTVSTDTPTVESPGQHRSTMGDSQAMSMTAKLISQQPSVPLQQSTSEHVVMIPVNAQAAKRGAAPSPIGAQQSGFLSPTLRIVILLCAITLLCFIGAVLMNMKKR
jgi:hypothetical protein